MFYPKSIFESYLYLTAVPDLMICKLEDIRLPLSKTISASKFPDTILIDGTLFEWKSSERGSVQFNSTLPHRNHYYGIRYKNKNKMIIVNGSYFLNSLNVEMESFIDFVMPAVILFSGDVSRSEIKERIEKGCNPFKVIGKTRHYDEIAHRFRSMFSANADIFKLVNDNTISIIVTSPIGEVDASLNYMKNNLNSSNIEIVDNPKNESQKLLVYSQNYYGVSYLPKSRSKSKPKPKSMPKTKSKSKSKKVMSICN